MFAVCFSSGTRWTALLPCAENWTHGEQKAHGKSRLRRVHQARHTANQDFAMCPSDSPRRNGLHVNGRSLQLNAVSIRRVPTAQHTANLHLCRVPWGSTRRSHGPVNRSQRPWTSSPLPCAGVRHTANIRVCRVLLLGTQQRRMFAVCWAFCTRQNKRNRSNPLSKAMNTNIMDNRLQIIWNRNVN